MIDEYEKLLQKLIDKRIISQNYRHIYNQEIQSLNAQLHSSDQKTKHPMSIGLLYLYYFTNFLLDQYKTKEVLSSQIKGTISSFDAQELKDEEARTILEKSVPLNHKLNVVIPFYKNSLKSALFSHERSSVDISKILSYVSGLSESDTSTLSQLFFDYHSKFEKNIDYLNSIKENLEDHSLIEFIDLLMEKIQNRKIGFDLSESEEELNQFFVNLDQFFEEQKSIDLNEIKFDLSIPETLADKNNKSYFFKTGEKFELYDEPTTKLTSKTEKLKPQSYISTIDGNPWDIVGAIVINPVKEGIGIASIPFVNHSTGKVYIAVIIEKEIDLDLSEQIFHRISSIRITSISDSTMARKDIITHEISETLDIPINLALFPTNILRYFAENNITDFPLKSEVLRTEYYPYEEISYNKKEHILIIPDGVNVDYSHSNLYQLPSPTLGINIQNKLVSLCDSDSEAGKIVGETSYVTLGHFLCIQLDFPSDSIIEKLLRRIRSSNDDKNENEMWKLRFTISKSIDVFEAESLLPNNIWKYIWHEKILLNPYEVMCSFIGFVPSGTVNLTTVGKQTIDLSRGIKINTIDQYFGSYLYSIKSEQNLSIGSMMGLKFDNHDNLVLVYTSYTLTDILKKIGRESSFQSQEKLAKRIGKVFTVENQKDVLHPFLALTYLLFYSLQFNVFVDFSDLSKLIEWIEKEFEFKFVHISDIRSIDQKKMEITITSQ